MNTLLQIAGWTLIHFLWQGAAIGCCAAAALRAMSRRSANVRYVFACIAMLTMLAAPAATIWLLRPAVFLTWGSAPHPGSVARGDPCAPLRFLAGAPCAPRAGSAPHPGSVTRVAG